MYDEFRDRLMVYSGDPLTKILKRGEEYTSVKTLDVISILDGYLKVNGEDKPLKDKLLRRAYLRMDEGSKILSDKLNFLFLQLPVASSLTQLTGTTLSKENYQSTTEWNAMQFR